MDEADGRLKATNIDIEFEAPPYKPDEKQKLKIYQVATLPQKIQLWLIVFLSLASLLSNLTSIATSIGLINSSNPGFNCSK